MPAAWAEILGRIDRSVMTRYEPLWITKERYAMSTPSKHDNVLPLIDELARVRVMIAAAAKREDEIKTLLKPLGPGRHTTDTHTLTITESERDVLDMKAVREKLSEQFLRAHTSVTKYLTLKVTPRKETLDQLEYEHAAR